MESAAQQPVAGSPVASACLTQPYQAAIWPRWRLSASIMPTASLCRSTYSSRIPVAIGAGRSLLKSAEGGVGSVGRSARVIDEGV